MSFVLLGILNSQVEAAGGGAYDLLETVNLTVDTATVTFSNLDTYASTYKHLQIRAVANASGDTFIRFNGVTSSAYNDHVLRGIGTSVQSTNLGTGSEMPVDFRDYDSGSGNRYGAGVVDILDFSSTSKNKTIRALAGNTDSDAFPRINLHSGLFRNTAAITSITIGASGSDLRRESRFSLYGIK